MRGGDRELMRRGTANYTESPARKPTPDFRAPRMEGQQAADIKRTSAADFDRGKQESRFHSGQGARAPAHAPWERSPFFLSCQAYQG